MDFFQEDRGRLAASRVHAHVQRPFMLHGEATCRVVDLHGRSTEVGQDEVRAGRRHSSQDLRQAREVRAMRGENFRAEPKRAKTCFRLGQFDGIRIQSEQSSSWLKERENFLRVSAVAQACSRPRFRRVWAQGFPGSPPP